VQSTPESERKELAILITADEEVSGYGTKMLLEKEGYRADFAIIIDGGSEKELVLKQKGFAQLVITTHGTGGHASAPWTTKNPIDSLREIMEKVHEDFPLPDSSQWVTTAVLTKIDSDNSLNQIPESTKGYIDVRFVDKKDLDAIILLIKECLREDETVSILESNNLFFVDVDNKNVADLKNILEKEMKITTEFSFENGTSDAIFFTEHAIPASLFRPKGGGPHMDSEWVSIDSLLCIYKVVYRFLITR
jgi:acetylornithine deacetylase/succinyl-diaminopimelate desuccinylase-like protein